MIRQTKKKMREVKLQLRFSLRLGLGLMTRLIDGLSLVSSVFRLGIEPATLLISALVTELLTSLTSYFKNFNINLVPRVISQCNMAPESEKFLAVNFIKTGTIPP